MIVGHSGFPRLLQGLVIAVPAKFVSWEPGPRIIPARGGAGRRREFRLPVFYSLFGGALDRAHAMHYSV